MKYTVLFLIGITLLLAACSKSTSSSAAKVSTSSIDSCTGMIYGQSPFMNDCSAAFVIVIDSPHILEFTFDSLPAGTTGIDPNFGWHQDSIPVRLNWHFERSCGVITIDAIERK